METEKKYNSIDENQKNLMYCGEAVYIYAFDIAYDMKRQPISELLGQQLQNYSIGPSKRSPKQLFFYSPQMAKLPSQERQINGGFVQIQRSIKVFNVGAISIQIRVPFQVKKIEDLVSYHDLKFTQGSIEDEIKRLAEKAKRELEPYCIKPVYNLSQTENYTVFCLHDLPHSGDHASVRAEDWLKTNRYHVAGLLAEEANDAFLSEQ